MNEYPWYGVVDDKELQQGDLLFSCPFDHVEAPGQAGRKNFNIIVMSQSCDLAQGKLEMVQVCPFWELEAFG